MDQNSDFYGADDEDDRKFKMSGFEDDQLQYTMSGLKPTRARSPKRKVYTIIFRKIQKSLLSMMIQKNHIINSWTIITV